MNSICTWVPPQGWGPLFSRMTVATTQAHIHLVSSFWRWSFEASLVTQVKNGKDGKESACNAGDPGLIPGWGRSPGEGNGNPLQHSCLENPMDRGAWQATVHGVAKSQTQLT